jgi:hypothetical protein
MSGTTTWAGPHLRQVASNSRRSDHCAGCGGLHQPWRNTATNHEHPNNRCPGGDVQRRYPAAREEPARTDRLQHPGSDIWVMYADGSNRRPVTKTCDPAVDFDPSLSPDGRRVVFRTSRGRYAPDPNGTGVQGIFVIDLDGSHERQIQPPQGGPFPDWSPDGRWIAFSTLRANGTETIVTTDPDGTHLHATGVVGGECAERPHRLLQLPRQPATAQLVPDELRRDRDPLVAAAAGCRRPDRLAGPSWLSGKRLR